MTAVFALGQKPKTVWVATLTGETLGLTGERVFAIVMNTPTLTQETEVDYLMANESETIATPQWFIEKYTQRNWIEVFYP